MIPPLVLILAGSDSGAGAGLQADLKTVHACGGYALTVVTAVTAQNTKAVILAHDLPREIIRAQIDAVQDDFAVAAVKTGMLSSAAIVEEVVEALRAQGAPHLVVDPVMISKSGYALLQDNAVEAVRDRLIPLAEVVTPNRFEAERLTGRSITTRRDMAEAGRCILDLGCRAVVVKGGHFDAAPALDLLVTAQGVLELPGHYIETPHTHGTGCTFASALATHLAHGRDLAAAVQAAKDYTAGAIRHGLAIGHGHGPTDHFWPWRLEA